MTSFERVIAATDLSDSSNRAVELAASIAAGSQAELHLCFVNESAGAIGLFPSFRSSGRSLHHAALEEQLKVLSRRIGAGGDGHTTAVVTAPHAANGILEYSGDVDSDLIVMGSRGHGVWRRAFLGSVALEIVENSSCSVLVVPTSDKSAEAAESVDARGPVLAVLDADTGGRVFDQARLVARSLSARLELAYVAPGKGRGSETLAKTGWIEELEAAIGGAMKLDSAQIAILDGSDGDPLVSMARRLAASVIVLSRQGYGSAYDSPKSALADRKGLVRSVLSKAFCPVLVVG